MFKFGKARFILVFFVLVFAALLPGACDAAMPAGCGAGKEVRQGGGLDATTINGALAQLVSPLGTDTCVVIRDTQTYSERIAVRNFAFTYSTNTLKIMSDPSFVSSAPVVNPPALSTAAFWIENASVTIQNISVISTNSVPYGVYASSGYLTISSVNVDSGGKIYNAGMSISSYSAILYSSVTVQNAYGAYIQGRLSRISYSTFTNDSSNFALELWNASSNTITGAFFLNQTGDTAHLSGGGYNTIQYSSITSYGASPFGCLYIDGSANNVLSHSSFYTPWSNGIILDGVGADNNTVADSTITTGVNSAAFAGIFFGAGQSNAITRSVIRSELGPTIRTFPGLSQSNVVSYSTLTSNSNSYAAVELLGAAGFSLANDYIHGSTAVHVSGSSNTVISGSILIGTNTTGAALWLNGGSVNLTVGTSAFKGGAQGAGIFLDKSNSGFVVMASNTITGGRWGVSVATMNCAGCNGNLSITSMTFSGGLTAGATAINFTGGTFNSTFTTVAFNDANITIDVNGSPLAAASRVAMSQYAGVKSGPAFENDPTGVVVWAPTSGSFALSAVNISSITVSVAVAGTTTYSLIASTAADFTGALFLSSTTDTSVVSMTVGTLAGNTTYYLRLDAAGVGVSFSSSLAAATLTAVPGPLSFTSIGLNQFTVNWTSNGNPAGTQYQVYVATDIAFATLSQSSFTAALSSTFTSLSSLTTYYVRARALNSAGTPTAYVLGAVLTVNGVVTVSANRLTGLWYNAAATLFFAQGAHHYFYKVTANPGDVPTGADTLYDGSALTVAMPSGSNYFHVLGRDASDTIDIGTAHFGPVNVDLGLPVVLSIAAQNSAADTTPIVDGGTTLAATPRLSWPAAVSGSPIVGYSLSLSTNAADAPGAWVTTTINFIDRVLTLSQVYYAKVAALNLAGTLGPVAAMSFTFSSTPSADRIVLRNNYFNPLRGGCTQLEVDIAAAGHLTSVVYDYTGQRIVSLADRDVTSGVYTYSWCGRNSSGALVASGIYLLHIEAPGQKKNLKLIILK